jgi:Flp pilus assembly pilin Flp
MHIEKRSLLRDERGLSTVEYTVLLVLIVAIAVAAWNTLGSSVKTRLDGSNTEFTTNVPVPGSP